MIPPLVTDVRDPHTGGRIAVDLEIGLAYPLTLCCEASGKGMEGGVGCRKCYAYVDDGFGMAWDVNDDLPDEIRSDVLLAIAKATSFGVDA